MTPGAFEQTLRQFLRSEPFQPFIVELVDGKQLLIDEPHTVSLGTQAAGFLSPEYDFYSIRCEQVRDIRFPTHQPIS
jgi:hypothetical protein